MKKQPKTATVFQRASDYRWVWQDDKTGYTTGGTNGHWASHTKAQKAAEKKGYQVSVMV